MSVKVTNPFKVSGLPAPEYFCDRERELQILDNHITNGRNTVLYAWRRYGKTALTKRLFSDLDENYHTIYIDLLATQSMEDAVKVISKAVYHSFTLTEKGLSNALKKMIGSLGMTMQFDPMTGAPEVSFGLNERRQHPDQSLETIGTFLSKQKRQIVIAFDEFQQVTHYKDDGAEAIFRSFVQSHPDVQFIFSGSSRSLMLSMFNEQNRPFYQSAQMLFLDAISREAYSEFILHHFTEEKKKISQSQIDQVYDWSRGQTYAIQLICNYLYERTDQVDEDLIHHVCAEIIDQQKPIFTHIQQLLTTGQWNVLRAVAKEEFVEQPLNKNFIHKHRLGAASSVRAAITNLQKREIIVEMDKGYCVHDVMFSRWLEKL